MTGTALVTGATGKVGHAIARALVARRHDVRALVLDTERDGDLLYGPGPAGSVSLELSLFAPLVRARLPFLPPGGFGLTFTDALAEAELLAAERGRPGHRYIVCDGYLSVRDLARLVVDTAGRGRVPPTLPPWLARGAATSAELVARVTGRPPPLSRGQLHSLLWKPRPRASKAVRELGSRPTPVEQGVRLTIDAAGLLDRSPLRPAGGS